VISSNIGGLPEVIQHGVNGFLENVGNVDAMANHGINLLSNEQMHLQFRKASLDRAKDFHIDSIVPMYESFFCQLIQCDAGVHA